MGKVKQAVDKLIGKIKHEDCDSVKAITETKGEAPQAPIRKSYNVEVLLSSKLWNKELQVYLFVDTSKPGLEVLTSKNRNFEFKDIESPWRMTDGLYSGVFDSVKISVNHNKGKQSTKAKNNE
jgi:hypothetical protein